MRRLTMSEFELNRQWGVTGYPTVLFQDSDQLYSVSNGYAEVDQMKSVIDQITSAKTGIN